MTTYTWSLPADEAEPEIITAARFRFTFAGCTVSLLLTVADGAVHGTGEVFHDDYEDIAAIYWTPQGGLERLAAPNLWDAEGTVRFREVVAVLCARAWEMDRPRRIEKLRAAQWDLLERAAA